MDNTNVPNVPAEPVAQMPTTMAQSYVVSSIYKRLGNTILDAIICGVLAMIITSMVFGWNSQSSSAGLFYVLLAIGYFAVSEMLWQKTPAKFITGTKVVMRDGSKPPFMNILGRSLARLIPFESLSFLFRRYPVGWHDKLSNTIVVDSSYSPEDVQKIDYMSLKQQKATGISIAVLLGAFIVPILIIVILAGVVFSSISKARTAGEAAKAEYERSIQDIQNRMADEETTTEVEQF